MDGQQASFDAKRARKGGRLRAGRMLACAMEALEVRRHLSAANLVATPSIVSSASTAGVAGYTPAQVLHAYGFDTAANSIGAVGGDGTGQTIAIVEAYHDPTLPGDVQKFDQQFNLPNLTSLAQIDQYGGSRLPATNATWASETALDVEWAHAVAPQADIIVVEAKSSQIGDLLSAVNYARKIPSVSIVSMSWGVSEFPTETEFDSIFTTPANHQNVTFIASSGDTANSDGVQWPAVSPNVVSVGGSTLTINFATGSKVSESSYSGAVSGVSVYESAPTYQSSATSNANRSIPDVVYDADSAPGFAVYDTTYGGWETLGGTSSGAPQWAGLVAIANQVRADAGKSSLNGTTQTLPTLYSYSDSHVDSVLVLKSEPVKVSALSLIGNSGASQTAGVITALVNNSSHSKASSLDLTDQSIQQLLAQAPHKSAHALFLNVAVLPMVGRMPMRVAMPTSSAMNSIAVGAIPTPSLSRDGLTHSTAAVDGTMNGLLAMTLPEMMQATNGFAHTSDYVANLLAALYGSTGELTAPMVVPVGIQIGPLLSESRREWYIMRINVAATFGDGMMTFINECAMMPPTSFAAATPNDPHHIRAWGVTAFMLALDGLVIYYLVSTRRERAQEYLR